MFKGLKTLIEDSRARVDIKKPAQKNPPKQPKKNLKKPPQSGFFWFF